MRLVFALFGVVHFVVAEVEKLSDSENPYPGEHSSQKFFASQFLQRILEKFLRFDNQLHNLKKSVTLVNIY